MLLLSLILACPPTANTGWEGPLCAWDYIDPHWSICEILDWNRDCQNDELDIVAIVEDVFSGQPCADLNCDGSADADDLADYINMFFLYGAYCTEARC